MPTDETRRERERRQHRQEILAAAVKLFSHKGFDKTTMADVAGEAEFAVGTLYTYFQDKEDLYRTIIREIAEEFHGALTKVLGGSGSEIEVIERYIDVKTTLYMKHISLGPLYFSQTAGAMFSPTAALDEEIQVLYRRLRQQLDAVFRRGVRKQLFAHLDPRVLTLTLEGLTHAFIPALVENPQAFTAAEMAAAIKAVFFERIRR